MDYQAIVFSLILTNKIESYKSYKVYSNTMDKKAMFLSALRINIVIRAYILIEDFLVIVE